MAVNYTDMPFFKSLNSYNRYLPNANSQRLCQKFQHTQLAWNETSFGITLNKDVEIFVFT